jgi:hypothetical protein
MRKLLFPITTLVIVLVLTSASSVEIEKNLPLGIQINHDCNEHDGENEESDGFLELNVQLGQCQYCGGAGGFMGQPGIWHGFCNGTGRYNNSKCTGCNGTGYLGAQCTACYRWQFPNTGSSSSSSGGGGSSGGYDSGYVTCKSCSGSGKCGRCDKGWTSSSSYYTGGQTLIYKCGVCNGTDKCGTCRGTGRISTR